MHQKRFLLSIIEQSTDDELEKAIATKEKESKVVKIEPSPEPLDPIKATLKRKTDSSLASGPQLFVKKQKRAESKSPANSPNQQSKETSKIRIRLGSGSPEPPSAQAVIAAKQEERRAQKAMKRSSLSPPPNSSTPAYSPSASPSPARAVDADWWAPIQAGIVDILKKNVSGIPINELVKQVKPLFPDSKKNDEIREVLKVMLKRVATKNKGGDLCLREGWA